MKDTATDTTTTTTTAHQSNTTKRRNTKRQSHTTVIGNGRSESYEQSTVIFSVRTARDKRLEGQTPGRAASGEITGSGEQLILTGGAGTDVGSSIRLRGG